MDILSWIVLGLLTGTAAGSCVGRETAGFRGDITFAVAGALLGGAAASQIVGVPGFNVVTSASALGGALVMLAAYRAITGAGLGRTV